MQDTFDQDLGTGSVGPSSPSPFKYISSQANYPPGDPRLHISTSFHPEGDLRVSSSQRVLTPESISAASEGTGSFLSHLFTCKYAIYL